ncbi:MAG: glycosyltransferase family 4 protein [Flavobacteriaceae bacterium]
MKKLIRITTVPISLEKLLENQLTFMSAHFDITAISADKERLEKFGLDNNVKTKHIELTRQITPLQDLKTLWQLYRFLKKEKPHIVHSHTPKAGTIGMLAAKLAGVSNRLHTIAGLPLLEATGLKRHILNVVEKITYAAATQILPNSYGLEKIILNEKFCKKDKLKVIANGSSNGINTAYFNPNNYSVKDNEFLRASLNINKNDFVFIFVGRLVSDKGINELIAAFKKLNPVSSSDANVSSSGVENKLLLVGSLETELDPLKKETLLAIENNKNIVSVGYQQDVRPYFAIANALTFPSYREGLPNVVLQAGAMSLPSIVTNINGCNEIIKHNENGLIISVKNKEAIFTAMTELLNNDSLYKKLKLNARKSIVTRYQQQVVWDALLEEYLSL